MWIGAIEFDLLLGDIRSLKEKRAVVRPIVAELRRTFSVSASEVGESDLLRRALVGVVVASGEARHAVDVLDTVERFVAGRPEIELLSAHRRILNTDDE